MSRKLVFGFKKYRPIDIAVFIGINVLVGLYVWKPFINEMQAKKLEQNPKQTDDNSK